MKAQVLYKANFCIPKELPHASDGSGDNDICCDSVRRNEDGNLELNTKCGTTRFQFWTDRGDHYEVFMGYALYEGARRALDAAAGVEFPEVEVVDIVSTFGNFETLHQYDDAREIIIPLLHAVSRMSKSSKDPAAEKWLQGLKLATRQFVDQWGNPINHD